MTQKINFILLIPFLIISFLFFSNSYGESMTNLTSERPIVFSKPVELNWKNLKWQSINYSRIPVDGGAAIYLFPSPSSLKFEITLVFPQSVFSNPPSQRIILTALSETLITGGSGNLTFEQLQNYITEYGINIGCHVNSQGQLTLNFSALPSEEKKVLDLISNILFRPSFEQRSLTYWKQNIKDSYENFIQLNALDKQMQFVDILSNTVVFGSQHYFSQYFERINPKKANLVTLESVKDLYKKLLNKNSMNVSISGNISKNFVDQFQNMIARIPSELPQIHTWLPGRDMLPYRNGKMKVLIVRKKDMTQSVISLRYYYPKLGELNSIEQKEIDILEQIFSSTGGVVGNDRFSKALRADSGISYSPHAYFNEKSLYPNTNVGTFYLNFQSPNDLFFDAVTLATKTFDQFMKDGITQEELDNTRTSMMNRNLATEQTVFYKSNFILSSINQNKISSSNPLQYNLVALNEIRDLKSVNLTLHQLSENSVLPVLVLLGNPDEKQIEKLKKLPFIDKVEIKDINFVLESYFKENNK